MVARERRRALAAARALIARPRARLFVLLGANLLALAVLVALLVGRAPVEAAPDGGRDGAATAGSATQGLPDRSLERWSEAPPAPDPELARRIGSTIANAVEAARGRSSGAVHGGNVAVAVHVRDTQGGAGLVTIQSDLALCPASNLKLLTSAAALVLLGPDWHFETRFEAAGEVRGGTLAGDLVARAGGDPFYAPEAEGSLDAWLDSLAAELEANGVRRVSGALVLDEGTFLEPGPGPEWPAPREHWKEYTALCGGFSANAGCLTAVVSAGRAGGRARVVVRPRHHGLTPNGEVRTDAVGSRLNVAVGAQSGRVTVRGAVPADLTQPFVARFAHPDPVELFGHAVVGGLRERGIEIAGGFRRERGAAPEAEQGEGVEYTVLARLRSPLAASLAPILGRSNNSVADQLFLALGHAVAGAGDRAGGAAAVQRAFDLLGVSSEGWVQVDGSGLSRSNRVTARQTTALLAALLDADPESARLLREALPLSGLAGGSLAERMRDEPTRGRVRAKTGWIGGASGLSGLAETLDGRTLAFSILVSYPREGGLNTSVWKPMQDAICRLLVESEKRDR